MTYKRAWKESKEVARWSLMLAQRPHRTDRISTLWAVRVEARTFETNRATSEAEVTIVSPSPPGKKGSSWVNDCKAIGGWVEKDRPGFGWVRMATAAIGPS